MQYSGRRTAFCNPDNAVLGAVCTDARGGPGKAKGRRRLRARSPGKQSLNHRDGLEMIATGSVVHGVVEKCGGRKDSTAQDIRDLFIDRVVTPSGKLSQVAAIDHED